MNTTKEQIDLAAAAIANARGARRGAPKIENILDLLPEDLCREVREDAKEALENVIPSAVLLIAAERHRQIEKEGYSSEHDDSHFCGEIACAAAVYATPPMHRTDNDIDAQLWPEGWEQKDCDRIRELTIAGALIAAEIDRLKRTGKGGAG